MAEKNQEDQENQEPLETQDEELCFDLQEKVVPVDIKEEDGTITHYELREASLNRGVSATPRLCDTSAITRDTWPIKSSILFSRIAVSTISRRRDRSSSEMAC